MSIKRIQQMTGYSYSTISRVLNGKALEFRISDKTRQIILKAAESLNYRPNIVARSLRMRRTFTIGLIVPDIKNPFFGELASRIESLLREQGYSTIICNTNEMPENEEFYLRVLVDRQVDGIFIAPIQTAEWKEMENISRLTAVVLIVRIFYQTELPWVTSDNRGAAEALTSDLIKLGYSRIAYLGGSPGTYINDERFQGYQEALRKHNLGLNEKTVLFRGYSTLAGEEMMRSLLERAPDIQAVFCINNLVFLGTMKAVQEFEIKSKRSVMIGAFDISRYRGIFNRPLISADQNMQDLADSAVSLLMDRIRRQPIAQAHITIPVSVNKYYI